MKWIRRIIIVAVGLLVSVLAVLAVTALRTDRPVGFEVARASAGTTPFALAIWYPTKATPWPTTLLGTGLMSVAQDAAIDGSALPIVVLSHGNGGSATSHADLAMSLANAGYVVAAPMHPGDNVADQSAAASPSLYSDRNAHIRATLDFMLQKWRQRAALDQERVGAFGFSAGGFAVLTAIGVRPDMGKIPTYCASSREFVCDVLKHASNPLVSGNAGGQAGEFVADPRIKAAVLAAPGLGFTLGEAALTGVRIPVQLWSGSADKLVPYASNARIIRQALGEKVQFHAVADAGHAAFLMPCGLIGPPALCKDAEGFNRKDFHRRMNASVISFFNRELVQR